MTYTIHSEETASNEAKPFLAGAKAKFGFIPNLLGVMASAPTLLQSYLTLAGIFDKTSLTPTERQIVLLATSHSNGCAYCMAAHTAIAAMQGVSKDVVEALRNNTPLSDVKLEALRLFTNGLTKNHGHPSAEALEHFYAVGYNKAQALEVVLGVGIKTISNYTNHLTDTPLDVEFSPLKWENHTEGHASACSC